MTEDFYQAKILPCVAIIIKICRAYTSTQEDFEDYYQEVCLQIWRSRDRFRGQSEWSTWVYRLSLNVCMTLLKRQKRHGNVIESVPLPPEAGEQPGSSDDASLNQLFSAIRQLSDIDRAVIVLYLDEKPYQEIADIIGGNANNVGVRISRIKQRLRRIRDEQIN